MIHIRTALCRCLMFIGVLMACPDVGVRAAPVPPTVCDEKCRLQQGPFQAGLVDDPKADCWWYPDDLVCNNCQTTDSGWNCVGPYSETAIYCVRDGDQVVAKEPILADGQGNRCTKYCDKLSGGPAGQRRVKVGNPAGEWTFPPRKICSINPP